MHIALDIISNNLLVYNNLYVNNYCDFGFLCAVVIMKSYIVLLFVCI